MQEKKEPAKITWRGAFWLIVAFSAIFAFTGWVYGENSGYDRGYEEGKQEIQSHLPSDRNPMNMDISRDTQTQIPTSRLSTWKPERRSR